MKRYDWQHTASGLYLIVDRKNGSEQIATCRSAYHAERIVDALNAVEEGA